ncbi:MAG: A/G-specific adenine glycosylase [Candidatus Woesearchaeota archaeon]
MVNDNSFINFFWDNISNWYNNNKRDFAWRKTNNIYYLLLAEFLLQQTNVEKVEKVYYELITKYPKLNDLAKADVKELKKIIKPLGLLYRANRIKNSAKKILVDYQGKVPRRLEELKSLPGVGEYIGEAVRCFGFEEKAVPIDTNVIRLFTRFFGLASKKKRPRNDKKLKENIRIIYINIYNKNNNIKIKKFNFAVLDFAAKVCKKSDPKCVFCPLSKQCYKYKFENSN